MTTEIAEYSATEAALVDLEFTYKGVLYDVTTTSGMKAAIAGRRELREVRVKLEKTRKELKEPALRRAQAIDSEARRITAILAGLEDPTDEQIKFEENRKENERREAERLEAARIAEQQRILREEEERKLAEERARLKAQQDEIDRQNRERERLESEARERIAAEERAARDRIEAAERKARQDREAEEARINAVRREAEEQAHMLQEYERQKDREEQEKRDALDRAARRAVAMLQDGYGTLQGFIDFYGNVPEFGAIAKAIGEFLVSHGQR